MAQWENERQSVQTVSKHNGENDLICLRHFHWLKLDTHFPSNLLSCAFYVHLSLFIHLAPLKMPRSRRTHINTHFIFIMLAVGDAQHKKITKHMSRCCDFSFFFSRATIFRSFNYFITALASNSCLAVSSSIESKIFSVFHRHQAAERRKLIRERRLIK